jgi:SAM-dependent methyltransferase
MSAAVLTDKDFWASYWADYEPRIVGEVPFSDLFDGFPAQGASFIEIGGFPGTFAAYFKKRFQYDVTLLDYFVVPGVVEKLERVNGLESGSIAVLKEDFLAYEPTAQYDVVFSAGFLEHFEDTEDILRRHCGLLKPGGTLFVSMPNFTGLHGTVQKIVHRSNYDAHNRDAMNMKRLRAIGGRLPLSQFKVEYYGVPMLHLEPDAPVSPLTRRVIWKLSRMISRLPGKNRLLAPNIIITGKK